MNEMPKNVRDYLAQIGSKGGKAGGKVGGIARARKLSPKERSAIARKAAQARWAKQKGRS